VGQRRFHSRWSSGHPALIDILVPQPGGFPMPQQSERMSDAALDRLQAMVEG
jgi:hypothetical protein